jgi:hypothetical protein
MFSMSGHQHAELAQKLLNETPTYTMLDFIMMAWRPPKSSQKLRRLRFCFDRDSPFWDLDLLWNLVLGIWSFYTSTTGFSNVPIPEMLMRTVSSGRSVKLSGGTMPVPVSSIAP